MADLHIKDRTRMWRALHHFDIKVMSHQASSAARVAAHSLRRIHASSAPRAAHVQVEELTIPPIFDIFDVPARLREPGTSTHKRPQPPPRPTLSGPSLAPRVPTSLPHPIIFDGPSRPRASPVARRTHHRQSSVAQQQSVCAPLYGTEPTTTMFDGPARTAQRPRRPESTEKKPSSEGRNIHLVLGGAAVATAATLGAVQS
ncbi:hypothetical protein B0H10DRAFT_2434786 [Mycena sp. CBHHK59/15]|nr:hypothetical protein B0H10DRAFT_2434786 [Mycena sp. CBHHK59/15]